MARANGEWVLGEAARQQAAKNQKNTFGGLMRLTASAPNDEGPEVMKFLKVNACFLKQLLPPMFNVDDSFLLHLK